MAEYSAALTTGSLAVLMCRAGIPIWLIAVGLTLNGVAHFACGLYEHEPRTRIRFWHPLSAPRGCRVLQGCSHGPQTWPWWKLFSVSMAELEVYRPSTGHRLWIYTRRGAVHFDLIFDRRKWQQSNAVAST